MYHQSQHQGKSIHAASRMQIPADRQLLLQGGNGVGDSGLVLSTDAKPRLKWTPDLHERFVEAVNQLGGADSDSEDGNEAYGDPGTHLYHLKSHLQKYRLNKNLHGLDNNANPKIVSAPVSEDRTPELDRPPIAITSIEPQANKGKHFGEALQMQIEVQRWLHEQLEVQRQMQIRIEAQGKYLQMVLEKAQETLGRQNLGSADLETAKIQISELVSKVSTQGLNSTFLDLKELHRLSAATQQLQANKPTDCSVDSCLMSCEGSQKDQEIHENAIDLRPCGGKNFLDSTTNARADMVEFKWCGDTACEKRFPSFVIKDKSRNFLQPGHLPMSGGLSGDGGCSDGSTKEKLDDVKINGSRLETRLDSVKLESNQQPHGNRTCYLEATLDLNARKENDAASICKQFDLNGFCWS